MLNDTIFLLARTGFDAVCPDRAEGPFPIRTHTGNVGGRVPVGAPFRYQYLVDEPSAAVSLHYNPAITFHADCLSPCSAYTTSACSWPPASF